MKHSLNDLNEYLFEQIDRLSNEDLSGDQLEAEIKRGDTISKVASTIIQSAVTQIKAAELAAEYGDAGGDKVRRSTQLLIGE